MPNTVNINSNVKWWKKDEAAPFQGWDFSYIRERHHLEEPDWNYEKKARQLVGNATSVLDMGTGGGEVFARLAPFPHHTIAVEDWRPNVAVASRRLSSLGVKVLGVDYKKGLPFQDGEFDLILNRHSALPIPEIHRILRLGGILLTQQVDGHNLEDLAQEFNAKQKWPDNTLPQVRSKLEYAGFKIMYSKKWTGEAIFSDVGAIVFFLKNIPWIVDGFTVDRHLPYLEKLQLRANQGESLCYSIGRFLIKAVKEQ